MFPKFSLYTRRALMAACVTSAIAISSCSDDETTLPDTDLPEVKLTSSATSDVVWNTVTLTVAVTDNQEIAQLELKIDGTSVKTATTSPFEFAWDTQKAAEGQHIITAIGTDKTGNTQSAELKVTVQNILLKTTVPSDFLVTAEGQRGFIFLSDKDGKIITSQEFKNGDPIELRSSSTFNESVFSVTQAVYYDEDNTNLTTVGNVTRGTWSLTSVSLGDDEPAPVGSATLNLVNAKDGVDYSLQTNGGHKTFFTKGADNPTMNLKSSPGVLYVTNDTESKYGVFTTITVGATKTIDLSQVTQSFTEITLRTPSDFTSSGYSVFGLPTATSKDWNYIHLGGTHFTGEYKVVYPATGFPGYFFRTRFYADNKTAYNDVRTGFEPAPLNAKVEVSLENNKYSGSVIGDDIDLVLYYLNGEDAFNFDWVIVGPKGSQSIVIPELPALVDDLLDPVGFEGGDYGVSAIDYLSTTGYDAILQLIRTSPDGVRTLYKDELTESRELNIDLTQSSDGRKANSGHKTQRRPTDIWRKK